MAVRLPSLFTFAAGLGLAATSAFASWPPAGVVVATPLPPIGGFGETALLTAPDGSIIALGSGATASSQYWGSQRATPSGGLTPVWPGLLETSTTTAGNGPGLLPHMGLGFSSAGDLLTSWCASTTTIRAQRMADWAAGAPTLQDRSFTNPLGQAVRFANLAPALNNDVYYLYGNTGSGPGAPRLMRRTAAGSVSPGWPVNGKRVLSTGAADGAMLPDGAGGVIISLRTLASEFRVLRMNADTTFAASWPPGGLILSTNSTLFDWPTVPQLLPSGADGYLACWSENQPATTPPTREISILRFLANDGSTDPAWPAEGVQVTFPSSTLPRFSVVPDGAGGAFVLFEREGEPRGTHILASGVLDPGLAASDVPLLDTGAQYDPGHWPVTRIPLVAAPGKNGGLVFVWLDDRDAPQGSLRARWLTSSLAADPTEPPTARRIPTQSATVQDVRAAVPDGSGGVYVAWGDNVGGSGDAVVMLQRVLASEFLSAPPPPHATVLALSAPRPNPSRGSVALDVTLPDDTPARIELLDVAGRVQRTQTVAGAGAHSVAFRDLGTLAPGLYFARASHPHGVASTRVVITK
jgi:hypothetical protein